MSQTYMFARIAAAPRWPQKIAKIQNVDGYVWNSLQMVFEITDFKSDIKSKKFKIVDSK